MAANLPPAATGSFAADAGQDSVVASVGNRKITEQEVESRLIAQLSSLQMQLYQLRKNTVEQMADEYLLNQAAKRAHLSVAAYLQRAVDSKVADPSDAQLRKKYEQIKDQVREPYDKVRTSLAAYMKSQGEEQRREALLEKLRREEGFKILLKPPRFKVAVGDRPALGPRNAPVTVLEFEDFQNPYCKRAEGTLAQVRARYADKVRLVYADLPLAEHPHAMDAALAARCAGEQGKFWQYHDALFAAQYELAPEDLKATAAKLKLDTAKFNQCLDKKKYAADVSKDQQLAQSLGVEGTPAFFVNGRPLLGPQPFEKFAEIIDDELTANSRHARN